MAPNEAIGWPNCLRSAPAYRGLGNRAARRTCVDELSMPHGVSGDSPLAAAAALA